MTTARTLEPEWIDLSGDLERIEKDGTSFRIRPWSRPRNDFFFRL